jgi:hypothetical protein
MDLKEEAGVLKNQEILAFLLAGASQKTEREKMP